MERPSVHSEDIERMANAVLLSYGTNPRRKYSAFWMLLGLAGVIATAGVVADSTATVIGAMIVAPLMTPILGTAFAVVIADRNRMLRSMGVVIGGALLVILIGYFVGLLDPVSSVIDGNSQINSRINPRLLDLVAALATGTVGAFALVRSDIADTLPGVAIAISLVPPLAVIGLTFEAGAYDKAFGALLLFLTNVTAIILTATLVLLIYQVRDTAAAAGHPVGLLRGSTLAVVVLTVLVVAIPLGFATAGLVNDTRVKYSAADLVSDWAERSGWKIITYEVQNQTMDVAAIGPPPTLDPESLRDELDASGFSQVDLVLNLVVGGQRELPGTNTTVENEFSSNSSS